MATTIMGGLFVATFLTLLFLPALYALWFRKSLDARGVEPTRAAEAQPEMATAHGAADRRRVERRPRRAKVGEPGSESVATTARRASSGERIH